MKKFVYGSLVDEENICNLAKEKQALFAAANHGGKVVFFGRRNTGKTSLLVSYLIPKFLKRQKKAFALFADFMGVKDEAMIANRLKISLQEALKKSFPQKKVLLEVIEAFKRLTPTLGIDPQTGSPTLTIAGGGNRPTPSIEEIFLELRSITAKHPSLIVLDEFQDIVDAKGADSILRHGLQQLSTKAAVILSGSKKHLMAQIFSQPNAPFAQWGMDLEISSIPYAEYCDYLNQRFAERRNHISLDVATELQDLFQRIPEPVNMLCQLLDEEFTGHKFSAPDLHRTLDKLLERSASRFAEYLTFFSAAEEQVLIAVARAQPVKAPSGREFLSGITVSQGGIAKILTKLLNDAIVYRTADGIILSDPLLALWLKRYR